MSAHVGDADDNDVSSVRLAAVAPFHLEATVRVLQRRPASHEMWEENRYLRVFTTADGLVLTAVANRGSIDAPNVRLSFLAGAPSADTRLGLRHTVSKMLGLALDVAPLHSAAMQLPGLRSTALSLRGMRPPRFATLFDAFANVVPFQQLSLDAGAAIVGRLVERFGERVVHGGRSFAAFPTASVVAGARRSALLACGLSRSKAESLRLLARAIERGDSTGRNGMSLARLAVARHATRIATFIMGELARALADAITPRRRGRQCVTWFSPLTTTAPRRATMSSPKAHGWQSSGSSRQVEG